MNSLERSLIHKAGYDHGWEIVVEDSPEQVVLASALHHARARIMAFLPGSPTYWVVTIQPHQIHRELECAAPGYYLTDELFGVETEADLGFLLDQAARLARALPDEPCIRFSKAVAEELAASNAITSATEVESLVRQRVGQNIYRESLMDYWGGACAVTGIAVPELLRASHAKPWAECITDTERLNVFNGFLLCAHLDALFDRHLMTFSETGRAIFAPQITNEIRANLGLSGEIQLRRLSAAHHPFIAFHRNKCGVGAFTP
ncbi:hypothetical protein OpiT1DRAFT_00799 [Opitutaceae bacterium TAV1]|nr:hypothetical protein OpiT1DRAFT_00799 [Opitutaceae bacterium TAV1]